MRRPPKKTKSRRGGQRPGRPANFWQRSEAFKQVGRKALRDFRAKRHLLPLCGANARSTGEACRQLAMANGKCSYHGGRTPAGDKWHVQQLPGLSTPKSNAKAHAKVTRSKKAAKERERRLAEMSPAERRRAEEWARTHRPGRAADRRREKEWRRQAADARASIEALTDAPPRNVDPQVAVLQLEIDRLEALKAAVGTAGREASKPTPAPGDDVAHQSESAAVPRGQNGDPPAADDKPGSTYPLKGVFL